MADSLVAGDQLHALFSDGEYYPAEVVAVKKKSKAPVKVSYKGYPGADAWLPLESLKSKKLPKAAAAAAPKSKAKDTAAPAATQYDYSGLAEGMRLQVELEGSWYAANVLTVTKAKGKAKAPVKVNFAGYGSEWDEWVGGDRIRSKAVTKAAPAKAAAPAPSGKAAKVVYDYSWLETGMRLQVEFQGIYYAANVVTVATGKAKAKAPVKVNYAGQPAEYDEWVGGDRIRSKALGQSEAAAAPKAAAPKAKAAAAAPKKQGAAPSATAYDYSGLEKGMRVQAELDGVWYAAEVVTVAKGKAKAKAPVKVSYVGYAGYDEFVGGDRIRSKALGKSTTAAAPEKKAAAAKYDFSGLEKGMRLQVEVEGVWYAAEVVTVKKTVKVHFPGYTAASDEWVGGDRIRSKAVKKA